MRKRLLLRAPAVERGNEIAQCGARLRLELVAGDHAARRLDQRQSLLARVVVQELHGGIAQAALGHVDDAFEGEIIGGGMHDAQIGERVTDFGALVKARSTDHAVRQPKGDEAVLELAHLERGAHQDGDLVELVAVALQRLDLLADRARFLLGIPGARHRDLFARILVGAQGLAEPALVVGDEMRGGGEDVGGRAIIALQPDHSRAGKILLEAQDVVDLGAAPAVDRLIVVADAADVLRALAEQPQPQILRDVGVLVLVDQGVFEPRLILREHGGMLPEQPDAFEQEVAEIGGVEHFQPILIGGIELSAPAVREARCLAGRHPVGREPAILPAVEEAGEQARRPALLVDVRGFQHLLEEADLVVNVQNGEIGFQPDELGMPPQDFHADGVEGAEPRHALDGLAEHSSDALLHLACRLVGEGNGENAVRVHVPGLDQPGHAGRENARLPRARAGEDQRRLVGKGDRGELLGIEVFE